MLTGTAGRNGRALIGRWLAALWLVNLDEAEMRYGVDRVSKLTDYMDSERRAL
jgi:hypothetical protein